MRGTLQGHTPCPRPEGVHKEGSTRERVRIERPAQARASSLRCAQVGWDQTRRRSRRYSRARTWSIGQPKDTQTVSQRTLLSVLSKLHGERGRHDDVRVAPPCLVEQPL